jgi:hypothetical protein
VGIANDNKMNAYDVSSLRGVDHGFKLYASKFQSWYFRSEHASVLSVDTLAGVGTHLVLRRRLRQIAYIACADICDSVMSKKTCTNSLT